MDKFTTKKLATLNNLYAQIDNYNKDINTQLQLINNLKNTAEHLDIPSYKQELLNSVKFHERIIADIKLSKKYTQNRINSILNSMIQENTQENTEKTV